MSQEVDFEIALIHTVKAKDLMDVLCTACEGGSAHWVSGYQHMAHRNKDGDYVKIEIMNHTENDVAPRHPVIGLADLVRGIQQILDGTAQAPTARDDIASNIEDLGMVDGDTADAILQVATFGEIVYG